MGKVRGAKPTFSEDEKKRYKEIAEQVKAKGKSADASAAVARTEKAVAEIAKLSTVTAVVEEFAASDGIMLDGSLGYNLSVGKLEVVTSDVTLEEPRVVADDDDEAGGDDRSLWGDGDADPATAE